MALIRFEVQGFRNLEPTAVEFSPGVNVIHGANAAGKTSLLEAIHFLARARSFATTRVPRLVQRGRADGLWVRGEVDVAGSVHRLGVGWREHRVQVRLNGGDVGALSEAAWLLPVQVINTEAQRLLTDGPPVRRSFLNWGVFHVEHRFRDDWRRYQRALRQRNAALRVGDARLAAAWEPELASAGEAVDGARQRFLETLNGSFQERAAAWLGGVPMGWRYRRGWSGEQGLAEALATGRERELQQGYTLYGPHRADLRLLAEGVDAAWRLSRGQQKLAVIALRLAEVDRLLSAGGARPLVLVDDLPAELDSAHRRRVLDALFGTQAQVFVTSIERDALPSLPEARVFHVEHGIYRREA
ncbi:DNA replication/repair protein RecF [Sediminicurvatus halobius]|uniref:DNA replication and repair protein RecF n=1 Tax=Sediminicurvatus halobius TaxID=2182432 RepID=A0A2U2N337_9GAMM|nr:DNA replication/repair protein RecF [Spiribacter halobius]PWG63389.1 DNA replication/repair protein RecF [Spiribacter halobius]UEX78059.1 DNA replication/repair protein RecF [Spiribacter halobius]